MLIDDGTAADMSGCHHVLVPGCNLPHFCGVEMCFSAGKSIIDGYFRLCNISVCEFWFETLVMVLASDFPNE